MNIYFSITQHPKCSEKPRLKPCCERVAFCGASLRFRLRAQNKGEVKLPDINVKDGASEKSDYKPANKRRATMGTE